MTHQTSHQNCDANLACIPVRTTLRSKIAITDDDDEQERVTPIGSIWMVDAPIGKDADYSISCPQTGGWVYFMASELRENFEFLPDFFDEQLALGVCHLGPGMAAASMLKALCSLSKKPHPTALPKVAIADLDSIDMRIGRAKSVLYLYGLMSGNAGDEQATLADILCDLMHAAVVDDDDFLHAYETATDNSLAECSE